MNLKNLLMALLLSCVAFEGDCQLSVTPNQTATVLASKLVGPGITISSPTLTCAGQANGKFISTSTPLGLDSGIVLTTGKAINTEGVETFLASTSNGAAGDAALSALAGTTTHDACYLEFDLVPNGDTVSFRYVFGSEEYINSVCGIYNDAFAFFISGPGITGTQNMALIPGTTIPVTVNSINNGTPGPGYSLTTCSSMGPGSPFTSYYTSNIGGTQLTYRGYTVPMTAAHAVIPCNTYHLKMTIADANNYLYDSGVFIEAGSLKTNTYHFIKTDSIGITLLGMPHTIVKGCNPATIRIKSDHASSTAQTVNLSYGGTAVSGVDFSGPSSTVIPAGDTIATINIAGLPTPVTGTQSLAVYLNSPFSCGIVDTINLTVLDSPTASILTPDTAICMGQSFSLRGVASSILTTTWSPATSLSSPGSLTTTAAPLATTVYTLTGTLAAAGCTPVMRSVLVTVNTGTVNILTPDTSICRGASAQLIVATGTPTTIYSWSPASGLNNPTLMNPIATPTATTIYTVTAIDPSTGGCPGVDQITITVFTPDAHILTHDTAICTGASFQLRASGASTLTYSWSPAAGLSDAALQDPIATPAATTTYSLLATVPGTPCFVQEDVLVTIIPPVIANANTGDPVCKSVPVQLHGFPAGDHYSYSWTGPSDFYSTLQEPWVGEANAYNTGVYTLVVTDLNTSCIGIDTVNVMINTSSIHLGNLTPSQTITYGTSIQLNASNAKFYMWTPNDGSLTDNNINNPIATPTQKTIYTVYGIDSAGCRDTASITIDVDYNDHEFIPTGFTPNGDGRNDAFGPMGLKYQKLIEFMVFNRWGQMVFSANSDRQMWDGTFNGQPLDAGVYFYTITVNRANGEKVSYKGDVALIR